jgi:hypothetical protein
MKALKSQKRRPETSPETEDLSNLAALRKELKKQTVEQVNLAGKDFFSQIIGYANDYEGPANDNENGTTERTVQAESLDSKKSASEPSSLSLKEVVLFQLLPPSLNEQSSANDFESKLAKIEQKAAPSTEFHKEYSQSITKSGENLSRREANEHEHKINQILSEIKELVTSTKALQVEFGQVTLETVPSNPGKYYTNFLEWLIIMIRQARHKVEESNSWLSSVQGKNSKKQGYWGKAKKMGTSFTQSNERNVATSTG